MSAPWKDDDREVLTLYLDGELAPDERRQCEKRLAREPVLRQQLDELQRTWDALNALQATVCDARFTTATLAAITGDGSLQHSETGSVASSPRQAFRARTSLIVVLMLTATLLMTRVVGTRLSTVVAEPVRAVGPDLLEEPRDRILAGEDFLPYLESYQGRFDRQIVLDWLDQLWHDHEQELLREFPLRLRLWLNSGPAHRRRRAVLRVLEQRRADWIPTDRDVSWLADRASPVARGQLAMAETKDAKVALLCEWIRIAAAWGSRSDFPPDE